MTWAECGALSLGVGQWGPWQAATPASVNAFTCLKGGGEVQPRRCCGVSKGVTITTWMASATPTGLSQWAAQECRSTAGSAAGADAGSSSDDNDNTGSDGSGSDDDGVDGTDSSSEDDDPVRGASPDAGCMSASV